MPNQSPYGNLTATLVVVAFFEVVVNRLLGRLFLSPGCHAGLGCLLLRGGPFLLHLTGVLTLMVASTAILGHLRRGELFPRGMRLTIAALSLIFLLLVALSLIFGRIPDRYQIHLETSFGFVVALTALSFAGSQAVSGRARTGFILFALPAVLHMAALVAARGGWLSHSVLSPERLTSWGEMVLLLAAVTSPVLVVPSGVPSGRVGAGLALAAGVGAFFFVALLGRTDLVQTVALYSVQLEIPRALSPLGVLYVLALFGFVTSVAVLLLSSGPPRLSGLGICLLGIAGYQTSSPVALGLSLCGVLALATGLARAGGAKAKREAPLSEGGWRSLLGAIATALADPSTVGLATVDPATADPATVVANAVLIEVTAGEEPGTGGESDTGRVRAYRRGRQVTLTLRRVRSTVRKVEALVGNPDDTLADATIESHEAWLGRRQEDRVPLPRMKTGDAAFDRKMGVHGRAPMAGSGLRRRILRLSDGTITLWAGRAARYVAPGNPTEVLRRFATPTGPATVRSLVEVVDTLIDLIEAGADSAPPDAA